METWKPVLVGVDATPESARAAALGWAVARMTHSRFRLVHVVPDPVFEAAALGIPPAPGSLQRIEDDNSRERVEASLIRTVPMPVITHLELHRGSTTDVLADLSLDAELLVLGGKHHSALGRWLLGSTVHGLVRRVTVPMLVAGPSDTGLPRRVLAAVDLSEAGSATLARAARFARMVEADLAVLHVVEPAPPVLDPLLGPLTGPVQVLESNLERQRTAEKALDRMIRHEPAYPTAEAIVRPGWAGPTIEAVAQEWHADVLAVGTHGGSVIERLFLSSVTNQLLSNVPLSLLVIPALHTVPAEVPAAAPGTLAWA